jgi:ribosomal-protein-alanine N-acetyltransferase
MQLPSEFPELTTDRLLLCETLPEDAKDVFAVLSQESIAQFYNIVPLTTTAQAVDLIERRHKAFQAGERIRWSIRRKLDDKLMGSCGFVDLNNEAHRAEIGYELGQEYQGNGFVTEALETMLNYGFTQLALNRIEAQVVPENIASVKVLERLGFQREGLLRRRGYWKGEYYDLLMFSLLQSDL